MSTAGPIRRRIARAPVSVAEPPPPPTSRPRAALRYTPRTRPVVPPIYQSVTYFLDDESYKDVQAGGLDEHWYGRFRNPTVDVVAEAVAALEGAEAGFMAASGMGAIATTLISLLRAGDRVVSAAQVYGDTHDLLSRDLPGLGIDVVTVDSADLGAWEAAISAADTRVVYAETLSNPQLEITDLSALAGLAHDAGAVLVVDNTFATAMPSRARLSAASNWYVRCSVGSSPSGRASIRTPRTWSGGGCRPSTYGWPARRRLR